MVGTRTWGTDVDGGMHDVGLVRNVSQDVILNSVGYGCIVTSRTGLWLSPVA